VAASLCRCRTGTRLPSAGKIRNCGIAIGPPRCTPGLTKKGLSAATCYQGGNCCSSAGGLLAHSLALAAVTQTDASGLWPRQELRGTRRPATIWSFSCGINTRAQWMGEIKPALERAGFTVALTSYGKFGLPRFLSPIRWMRRKATRRVVSH
jgi:hypothetical protein